MHKFHLCVGSVEFICKYYVMGNLVYWTLKQANLYMFLIAN